MASGQKVRRALDSLVEAVHSQHAKTMTPISVVLETMRGIDELSIADNLDKMVFLSRYSLKNKHDLLCIKNRAELEDILSSAGLKRANYQDLSFEQLQSACLNVMLALVEKMNKAELHVRLLRNGWHVFADSSHDQLKEAMRIWIQMPNCPLFEHDYNTIGVGAKHSASAMAGLRIGKISSGFVDSLHFFLEYEIKNMSISQLRDNLALRLQATTGARTQLEHRFLAYQEFLISRVMNDQEVKSFLRKCYWNSQLDLLSVETLRKRCLFYLKYPNYSRFVGVVNSRVDSYRPGFESYIENAHKEATRIYKRIYLDNPKCSDISKEARKLENIIPSDTRVNLDIIEQAAPICSNLAPYEPLWTYRQDLAYSTSTPDFWKYVSQIILEHYRIQRSPGFWERYWNFHKRGQLNESDREKRYCPITNAKKLYPSVLFNDLNPTNVVLYSHPQIDSMPPAKLQPIIENVFNLDRETLAERQGEKQSLSRILKDLQESFVAHKYSDYDCERLLSTFCWRSSQVESTKKKLVNFLLKNPGSADFLSVSSVSSPHQTCADRLDALSKTLKEKPILSSPQAAFHIDVNAIVKNIVSDSKLASESIVISNKAKFLSAYMKRNRVQIDPRNCKELLWSFTLSRQDEMIPLYTIYDVGRMKISEMTSALARYGVDATGNAKQDAKMLISQQDDMISSLSRDKLMDLFDKYNLYANESLSTSITSRNRMRLISWTRQPASVKHREPHYYTFSKAAQWRTEDDQKLLASFDRAKLLIRHLDDHVVKAFNTSLGESVIAVRNSNTTVVEFLSHEFKIQKLQFAAYNFWSNVASIAQSKLGLTKSAAACKHRYLLLKNCGYDTAAANNFYSVQRERIITERQKERAAIAHQSRSEGQRILRVKTALNLQKKLSIFKTGSNSAKKHLSEKNEVWERIKKLDDDYV